MDLVTRYQKKFNNESGMRVSRRFVKTILVLSGLIEDKPPCTSATVSGIDRGEVVMGTPCPTRTCAASDGQIDVPAGNSHNILSRF